MKTISEHRSTHWDAGHNWALILAAGEGSRLQALTTTASGLAVPKQYCSVAGDGSLLHKAVRRAQVVAPWERTCAVVAAEHERWWRTLSHSIPAQNIVVQPRNRGTAYGILLPLLQIVHRDHQASLLVLPSDHYVRNEALLADSLQQAMAQVERQPGHIALLGLVPEEADPELGYIVPGSQVAPGAREVQQFVEKPSAAAALELMAHGGLWNSFIFAVRGQTLVRAFEAHCPQIVAQMLHIVADEGLAKGGATLAELYEQLPALDFSRDIVQLLPQRLRVLTVPACGWNDLGTPRHVAKAFEQHCPAADDEEHLEDTAGFLDLFTQHQRSRVSI
jgi:mannose-1-phosphate guanylyltransferase